MASVRSGDHLSAALLAESQAAKVVKRFKQFKQMALPSLVSQTIPHKLQSCKKCGISLSVSHESTPVEKHPIGDIPEIKPSVIEHVFYRTTCSCGHKDRPDVPAWMYSGTGENLQVLIAYLTVEGKLSRRTLQSILGNVFHVPLALGAIQNRLEDTSRILQPACNELLHTQYQWTNSTGALAYRLAVLSHAEQELP